MAIVLRTYVPEPLFGADYEKVRDFLLMRGHHGYPFGRWDWMITHSYLDASGLPKIGMWEEDGRLVALATYDCGLGTAHLLFADGYRHLFEQALLYAQDALAKEGKFRVRIDDNDAGFQDAAARHGYIATQDQECDAVYPIGDPEAISYTLPEGFRVVSMREQFDLYKYGQALWKGFNHERDGEGPFVFREEDRPAWELTFLRPNVDLDLKIAVVAPNGDFVSYCGMWKDPHSDSALVEPVATDPAYRKMGLGRAAVLEAVKRCGRLGAKRAFVGSSQQFYYAIGFRPYATGHYWVRKP